MARGIELYLVRHAIAAERGPRWPDDTKRPLTSEGITRFREVVRAFAALDPEIQVVLTSPLVRAAQTAALLAEGLNPHPEIQSADALAPGGSARAIAAALARTRRKRIACVGHEPDLGQLAARLIGASRPLEFKKGGICRIDLERPAGPGHLAWFAPPRLLRRR
jgi:phosphohistidine phosphatase